VTVLVLDELQRKHYTQKKGVRFRKKGGTIRHKNPINR
jgi:hypothetical protein